MVTDQQVRRLRMLIKTKKTKAIAASKAGMDEKTARKYIKHGQLPSQCKEEHNWRTSEDPFEQEWEEIKEKLKENPGITKVKTEEDGSVIFEDEEIDEIIQTFQVKEENPKFRP